MKSYLIILNVLDENVLDRTTVLERSHGHPSTLVAPDVLNSRLLRRALHANALITAESPISLLICNHSQNTYRFVTSTWCTW